MAPEGRTELQRQSGCDRIRLLQRAGISMVLSEVWAVKYRRIEVVTRVRLVFWDKNRSGSVFYGGKENG